MENNYQQHLFTENQSSTVFTIEDGKLDYFPTAFDARSAESYLQRLIDDIDWRQDNITIAGKLIPIPRLQAWFGDPGMYYTYSGLKMTPGAWPSVVADVKQAVERVTGRSFNSALVNYYRDGQDSVGWHSDNERELGEDPVIASVSFGARRVFELKHKKKKTLRKAQIQLDSGSILVMSGQTQKYWKHQLPRDRNIKSPRLNLTFRTIVNFTIKELTPLVG